MQRHSCFSYCQIVISVRFEILAFLFAICFYFAIFWKIAVSACQHLAFSKNALFSICKMGETIDIPVLTLYKLRKTHAKTLVCSVLQFLCFCLWFCFCNLCDVCDFCDLCYVCDVCDFVLWFCGKSRRALGSTYRFQKKTHFFKNAKWVNKWISRFWLCINYEKHL